LIPRFWFSSPSFFLSDELWKKTEKALTLFPPPLPLSPTSLTQDLENTAGSWDMYGQADGARYPGLQAEFFERAAAPIARREAVLGLLGLVFPSAVVAWGIKGAKDVKLPITVGPQKPAALGPRDKL
jgi:photosystem I subunit VI